MKNREVSINFLQPQLGIHDTIEPLFEISEALTSSEYSVGQTSNVYESYVFWEKKVQSSDFALDVIDSGYRLPFKDSTPNN